MRARVTDFGAIADGKTLNTDMIQQAIHACAEAGGGTVVIPPGRFLSGTLELRSHVELFLEAGAVLIGSPRVEDYRHNGFVHPDNYFSQSEGGQSLSLIYADGAEEVGIRGPGSIDLSSDAFFDFDAIKPITGVDEAKLTPAQRAEASVPKIAGPTQPIFFTSCRRVEISGVRILNSPSLTINLNLCSDVRIHHITIDDDPRVPISDGIHICASKDVIITDSVFVCGDDCVAITGVTNWEGVSERIIIANCTMQSSSAAVRVGYMAGKVRDVAISNLTIHNTNRGFTIFAGDDGFVENVSIQNIVMQTRIYAGDWWGKGEPLVICAAQSQGRIENIQVRGLIARCENGAVIMGNGKNVKHILLADWTLELSRGANHDLFGGMIDLQPVALLPSPADQAPWLYVSDATGVRLSNVYYRAPEADDGKLPAAAVYDNADIALEQNVAEMI